MMCLPALAALRPSARPVAALLLAVSACAAPPPDRNPRPQRDGGGEEKPKLPAAVCQPQSARWEPGTPAFREATAAWGLEALGVEGVRLSAVDLDGDGWTDLVVRRAGTGSDDFGEGGVRRTWVLRNTGSGFEDVTVASGLLRARGLAEGRGRPGEIYAFADVDNDGDLDAFSGTSSVDAAAAGETSELLLNVGGGRFELGPSDAVAGVQALQSPAGASFVDFDLDGRVDLWVPQHGHSTSSEFVFQQDRLFRNLGDGAFADATSASGLETLGWTSLAQVDAGLAHSRAWSAAACDLNGDGRAELLAASYGRAPNHLWQAGAGPAEGTVFANRSVESGYAFDGNQSWHDNEFARCYCAENRSAQGCADVPLPSISCQRNWIHSQDRRPFRLGGNSGTTVCADVDNDGDLDLLTTEIRHWWAGEGADQSELLVNSGDGAVRFERPGRAQTGLVIEHADLSWDEGHMTAAIFDFDNDGWPDIYLGASDYPGNRGLLFHQDYRLSFRPVPLADGIDHPRSHGVAVADFDRDGDLDLVVGHSHARCGSGGDCLPSPRVRFFENVRGDQGNWLQVKLVGGEGSNRAAIGARVTVEAAGIKQVQEVGGGHGHYGIQHDLVLHFGLGTACSAKVTVRWPNRALTTEKFELPAGHRFVLRQGEAPSVAER